MTILLKQLFAFLKLLNSDTGHNQLASGLAIGLLIGFAPAFSIQTLIAFFVIFFFRVQIGAAFVSAFFFKFVAWAIDPVADSLGRWILESPDLRPLFVEMYNMPLVPLTRFNHSITMGAGVLSIVLAIPGFFLFRLMIVKYRVAVVQKFQSSKAWKAIQATSFYKWYATYDSLYG